MKLINAVLIVSTLLGSAMANAADNTADEDLLLKENLINQQCDSDWACGGYKCCSGYCKDGPCRTDGTCDASNDCYGSCGCGNGVCYGGYCDCSGCWEE